MLASILDAYITAAMRAVARSIGSRPASSLGFYSSRMAAAESDAKVVFEVSINSTTNRKEVAVHGFDPPSYSREEVWLTIFEVDEVENSLCTAFQTHGERLVRSARTRK